LLELALIQFRSVTKIIVHRLLDHALRVNAGRPVLKVHDQSQRFTQGIFRGPADDEFLQIVIEILS
jgi:hypothetical protein